MRRSFSIRTIGGLLLVLICVPAWAAPADEAAQLLLSISARLRITNTLTHTGGSCQGFVYTRRGDFLYVVSAKHCVEKPATPVGGGPPDYHAIQVLISFARGTLGRARRFWITPRQDILVLEILAPPISASWRGSCPACQVYRNFGRNMALPVISTLVAGGGRPVVSTGTVRSFASGRFSVVLPASPGTSGSVVLDLRGNLVGTVITVSEAVEGGAGWRAGIVPGMQLVEAVDAVLAKTGN